jgi:O-antigen/teichoic acid export membrane protein
VATDTEGIGWTGDTVEPSAIPAGPPETTPYGRRRRVTWTLLDQCLSSLTNFAIALVAARQAGVGEFGAFSVALTTYLLLLGLSRSICTDPLVVRFSVDGTPGRREAVGASTGAALAVSLVAGVACALVAVVCSGALRASFLALAVSLPGLLVQDSMRFVFFAMGRPARAAANDLVWVCGQAVLFLVLFLTTDPTPALLLGAWGTAATLAAVVGPFQTGIRPLPQRALRWFRSQADLSGRYLLDFFALAGQVHMLLYALGVVAGVAAFGSYRAAQLLLGPLNTLFFATLSTAVPEGARLRANADGSLYRMVRNLAIALPALALAWVGALTLLPDAVGTELLGASWPGARDLIVIVGVGTAVTGVIAAADSGLRALAAARRGLRARVLLLPLVALGGLVGAALGEAAGFAAGLLVANTIGGAIFWAQFSRAVKEDGLAVQL